LKTTAIIPVKRLDDANQRLADVLTCEERRAVAQALLSDTVAKLRRSRYLDDLLVVTSDPDVIRHLDWVGVRVLKRAQDNGHSEAAMAGVAVAMENGAERVAMLPADCPLLDPAELDARLGLTPRAALIVPDRHGTGTNALVLCPPDAFKPAFGPDSCARHVSRARAAGISFALESVPSLGIDLDTPDDMIELRDRLLLAPEWAPRTAKLLWELGAEAQPAVA